MNISWWSCEKQQNLIGYFLIYNSVMTSDFCSDEVLPVQPETKAFPTFIMSEPEVTRSKRFWEFVKSFQIVIFKKMKFKTLQKTGSTILKAEEPFRDRKYNIITGNERFRVFEHNLIKCLIPKNEHFKKIVAVI